MMLPRPFSFVALVVSLVLGGWSCGAELPGAIRQEMDRSPAETTTVVVFTDFQCPYCRHTHAKLEEALAAHPVRSRVVLVHVPLRSHPDARTAARASICGEALLPPDGARALNDAMYRATDLSEPACERMAVEQGVNRASFRACVASDTTEARIAEDRARYRSVGGDGVPLVYVDRVRIDGEPSRPELEHALAVSAGSTRSR